MTVPFLDLKRQYASIREEVDAAMQRVVDSAGFILGEDVRLFEEEFAAYCETRCCVGVASGTAAVELALQAVDVGPGDEVIAPANTFIATVSPVLRLGAHPVLVDCEADTALLDPELVAAAITPRTKAIIGVDLFGQPADWIALADVCSDRGIALVEDACQAHGARLDGRRAGSFGRVAAFSFYPGKNLGAYGDAGAVTTDDEELAARIRLLRDLGQRHKYDHVVVAGNERLDTLQAAVLRVKLRHLDEWNAARQSRAALYAELLEGIVLPGVAPRAEHVWHLFVVRVPERDAVREALGAEGVATGLHYPTPLHLQPALRGLGYAEGDFPNAEEWAARGLSLPMFAELRAAEVERVAATLRASMPSSLRGA